MKNLKHSLILAVLAVLALSCRQILSPPAIDTAGEDTGRVVLTVSAVKNDPARTILPAETPVFSRYELVFSRSSYSDITITNAPAVTGAGVSQELDAGTWTATVSAYRTFTPTGGSSTEYLAARGSESVTVTAGQVTPVTVSVEPVMDATVKGIFTYTVKFPAGKSGELTIGGDTYYLNNSPETASVEVDPGYHDLTISLTNAAWTLGAVASEKVHIYSGLESRAEYEFTNADFVQTIPLAGTVTLGGGASFTAGTIGVYSDSAYSSLINTAAIPAGGTAWRISVPASYAGYTLYFKLDAFSSDGNIYTAAGDTGGAVTEAGLNNVSLIASTVTPTALGHNTWTAGAEISSSGEVDWYTFTATSAAAYYVQWDDGYNSAGGKTLSAYVSAYHADGTPVFTNATNGYSNPRSVSVGANETVYIRVEGQWGTGTYALRYYNPAGLPPQTAPSYI